MSSSPAVARYVIALQLAQLREKTGLTKQDAGRKIGRTGQTISNIEAGTFPPSQSDLHRLLDLYDASNQYTALADLLPAARQRQPKHTELIPDDYELRLNLESGMAALNILSVWSVPGLLQTPAYATAVFRANIDYSDQEIKQLVDTRMQRKGIFTDGNNPVELRVVLDESVLHRKRGDHSIMAEQLDYLLEVARTPAVDLQILPQGGGPYLGEGTSWTIMEFPEPLRAHPGLVHLDIPGEALYYDDPDRVKLYRRIWRHVMGAASSPEQSLQTIRTAREQHVEQQ